jgi:alkylated DNA repair dioxygenase AlkB
MRSAQADLFSPSGSDMPEGLAYRPDVLTPAEESGLAGRLAALGLKPFEFHAHEGNRRVASFGVRYDFAAATLRAGEPIPDFLLPLRDRAARFAGLEPDHLPHALVTEYRPGAGIGWHKDRPDFEDVIGVSLVSECRFRLRRRKSTGWERASLLLEPRSIYLLRGPVRREWEHSIAPGDRLRYSVTFRSLRGSRDG